MHGQYSGMFGHASAARAAGVLFPGYRQAFYQGSSGAGTAWSRHGRPARSASRVASALISRSFAGRNHSLAALAALAFAAMAQVQVTVTANLPAQVRSPDRPGVEGHRGRTDARGIARGSGHRDDCLLAGMGRIRETKARHDFASPGVT